MKTKLLLAAFFLNLQFLWAQNPIAYYPFNGNANDESGNGNNGTVNGASLTTDRFGNFDSAFIFDGINDHIVCLQPGPIGTSPRTISFWAKTNILPSVHANVVLYYGGVSNSFNYGDRIEISLNSYNRYGLVLSLGGSVLIREFDNSDNNWHFYTVVFEGGTGKHLSDFKMYADGILLTNTTYLTGNTYEVNTASTYPITIGNLTGYTRYFSGSIDDIKVYDVALTDDQIQAQYQNLVAYYPFNGNANDESGYDNHGTVIGATLTTDRFGNPDSAYVFDGNDIISVPHADILNSSDELSFSVWVKPNGQQNAMILGKSNYTTATNYLLRTKSTGFIQFEYKDFANSNSLPLDNNEWNHVAVVSNAENSKKIYINGVLATHTSASSPYGLVTNSLTIGARSGAEFFNGSIDDLRIYKSALTESEVLSLYNNNTLDVSQNVLSKDKDLFVSSNTLYFSSQQDISEIKNISIYNILAREIYHSTKIQYEMTLDFLDQGIYILKVESKTGNIDTKKFLIQ